MMFKSHNSRSQKFRIVILLIATMLLIANLFRIEYGQLLSGENLGEAFGILANLFLIAAMRVSLRYTAKNGES
ncbi:hypothetical protein HC174_02385 [Salinimicrobium sp. CDJ15-81-2]|nr:hypothetical protein [Salinimicrobium nanhaiense]